MLGVGDAISPDFCLTIPRHWARSLAARGIEPLGRTCNEKYLVRSGKIIWTMVVLCPPS